jgi:pSer/pThr/pTyr-binding forkhead associated (FHA) protein
LPACTTFFVFALSSEDIVNHSHTLSTPTVRLTASFDGSQPKTIPLLGERFLIGRDPACQLRPRHSMVSRRHAEIRIAGDDVYLRDLGSSNGTFLNDTPVTTNVPMEDGDTIRVGPLEFTVSIQTPAEPSSRISFDDDELACDREPSRPISFDDDLPSDEEVAKWLLPGDDNHKADATHKGQ